MSKPAILIVEDEAIVAEDLSIKIRHLGYEVAGTLVTGEEAVEFVRRQPPALVLMDIRLAGDMDGIAAALEIRRECDLPVVFLTAHADGATVTRAQQAEPFGYILKPFEDRDLRIQIEMAIYKHAVERRLRDSEERLRNQMQDSIIARQQAENAREELRRLNQELESRVSDRTTELRQTIAALESEILTRQRLEREILEISEREQSRIGQDLHDGLGQELVGTALLGEVISNKLQAESHPAAASAARLVTCIRSSIESVRGLAKGLYPIYLTSSGLLDAFKDLANQTSQRAGIRCELRENGDLPRLDPSAAIHIYRIVQESIGNAIKHGRPRHILIESRADGGNHLFSVTDDGVGFAKSSNSSGMGLHLMRYRARVIGAQITIEQPRTGGCRITCRINAAGEGAPT